VKKIFLIFGTLFCTGIASASIIYDSTISPLPPNTVSEGYQCCQNDNLGNAVTFDGSDRNLDTVTVVMSNWAYESAWANLVGTSADYTATGFYLPLTLNLYVDNAGAEGALLGSQTINAFIPWRPEPDAVNCSGTAWQAGDGQCYNGQETAVNFDFAGLTVPDSLIYTLAFNTQTYGQNPTGVSGPYNSLNFGLTTDGASVGSDTYPGSVIRNNALEGDWTPYTPQVQFNATSATPEPGTWMLMLGSLAGVAVVARRRVKA
jgi:hypothetical protein